MIFLGKPVPTFPDHASERAVVLVQQPALDGNRAFEGRLAMGHDGVMRRPRRDREAVIPDLAEARVRIADHMEGGGFCRACGGEGRDGDEGGSAEDAKLTHGGLSPVGVSAPVGPAQGGPFAKLVSFGPGGSTRTSMS